MPRSLRIKFSAEVSNHHPAPPRRARSRPRGGQTFSYRACGPQPQDSAFRSARTASSRTSAITTTLSDRCDFAQLIKVCVSDPEGQRRYSPPDVTHTERVPVMGKPDPAKICTSHVERQNLTIRTQMRRLTRLTNAFSKKWENLWAAYCLHFGWYNFCRIHQSLRITPAMAARGSPITYGS